MCNDASARSLRHHHLATEQNLERMNVPTAARAARMTSISGSAMRRFSLFRSARHVSSFRTVRARARARTPRADDFRDRRGLASPGTQRLESRPGR
jgi:ligand-binding sensor domain-containing protein